MTVKKHKSLRPQLLRYMPETTSLLYRTNVDELGLKITKTTSKEKNYLNSALREQIMQDGRYMFSKAKIGDDIVLRPVISNPKTTRSTLDGLISEVLRVGKEISSLVCSDGALEEKAVVMPVVTKMPKIAHA